MIGVTIYKQLHATFPVDQRLRACHLKGNYNVPADH